MVAIQSERILLEIIACTVEDARNAEDGGADRLEIVQDLERDGLTPKLHVVEAIRGAVSIPLHVMIRSRDAFSDFSAREIHQMRERLLAFQKIGVDGVVLGFLSNDGKIDFETMKRVLDGVRTLSVTFHRAFDRVKNQRRALHELIEQGSVNRILTSGGASTAWEGKEMLAELVQVAKGRIAVMAGGGIAVDNVPLLARSTGVREFHIGRAVRTHARDNGTVDVKKVSHLASMAKTIIR